MLRSACAAFVLMLLGARANADSSTGDDIRLYVLECGSATLDDGGVASDTGELDHRPLRLADPCFVVRHPRGWLLWDAGLGPQPPELPGLHYALGAPIMAQLQAIGVPGGSPTLVAFSHLHFDHVGGASSLPLATWILNRGELAWAEHEPAHVSMFPRLFAGYRGAKTLFIEGDHDVFGDGRVRILLAPGHTPGSSVLSVDLAHNGRFLLSGDLYVSRRGRRERHVPRTNASRADTLASMERIERIARLSHARVIIQHDPEDYAALPKAPAFLD